MSGSVMLTLARFGFEASHEFVELLPRGRGMRRRNLRWAAHSANVTSRAFCASLEWYSGFVKAIGAMPLMTATRTVFRMATQVDKGCPGTVRAAGHRQDLVAERGAHLVEVVHSDRRRVQRQVGRLRQRITTSFEFCQPAERRFQICLCRVAGSREVAAERIRPAGTPLVDQQDVLMLALPGASEAPGGICGGSAGGRQTRRRKRPIPAADPARAAQLC